MMGSIGWLCPKCNIVYAPSQTTCSACSGTKLAFGTMGISSVFGTIVTSSPYKGFGTVFIGSYPSESPPPIPIREWEEERADQVIKDWKGGKWSTLQELIVEALEEAADED